MKMRPLLLILSLSVVIVTAQDKPSQSSDLPAGSVLRVMLSEPLQVENCKVGDQFRADVLGLVEGRKIKRPRYLLTLFGHVTEVQVRTAQQPESRLGIAFDKLSVNSLSGNGRELTVSAVVKGVTTVQFPIPLPAPSSTIPTSGDDPVQRAAGPMVDNLGRPVHQTPPPISEPGPAARALPRGHEETVKDFSLQAEDSTGATIITSRKRNIVLGPDSRLILQVTNSH